MNNFDMCDPSIVYICDGAKCDVCSNKQCKYTADIDHALNFKKMENEKYIERDSYKDDIFDKDLTNAISAFINKYPDHIDELYDAIYRVLIYLETSIWCDK